MLTKILVGFFIFVGVSIAVLSVYKASVDGLMQQVGLVGSDFSSAVIQEKMALTVSRITTTFRCDLPTRIQGAITFMLSNDQDQGKLAFTLGSARIQCGARILADGNSEVGTYEVLKGLGYLKQGYIFVQERADVDRRVCDGLPDASTAQTINGILDATSGKVYQLIWNEWQSVQSLSLAVDPICLDQRMKTR